MADRYVTLPLYDDSFYEYGISLQGQYYILEFQYNERAKLYFFNLYTDDRVPVVLGEALVPTYPLFKDYNIEGLTGFFWLEEKANILSEPYKVYPDKLTQYYNFFYLYTDDV